MCEITNGAVQGMIEMSWSRTRDGRSAAATGGMGRATVAGMNIKDVEQEIEEIRTRHAGDDEVQHSSADALWELVLEAIAKGDTGDCTPAELAEAALKVNEIDFGRWYA